MRAPWRIRGAALIQGGEKCLVALRAAIQFVGLQRLHRPVRRGLLAVKGEERSIVGPHVAGGDFKRPEDFLQRITIAPVARIILCTHPPP